MTDRAGPSPAVADRALVRRDGSPPAPASRPRRQPPGQTRLAGDWLDWSAAVCGEATARRQLGDCAGAMARLSLPLPLQVEHCQVAGLLCRLGQECRGAGRASLRAWRQPPWTTRRIYCATGITRGAPGPRARRPGEGDVEERISGIAAERRSSTERVGNKTGHAFFFTICAIRPRILLTTRSARACDSSLLSVRCGHADVRARAHTHANPRARARATLRPHGLRTRVNGPYRRGSWEWE